MRYTKLLIALLSLTAILFAADPYVGTWKMNSAKSKYKTGTAPKEQTVTISESGSDLITKVAGIAADGSKIAVTYSIPAAGGPGKIIESTAYDGVSGKTIAANEREVHYMKGGKDVYTAHSKVTGKTLTVSTKGTNALGQQVEATVIYEKQ
jgi:hypothetical protein